MDQLVATEPITLTLNAGEAMLVLDAINTRAVRAWENVRKAVPASDEREISETTAVLLDRVARRLDGAIFTVCRWTDGPDCTAPIAGYIDDRPFCMVHLARQRAIAEALETATLPW